MRLKERKGARATIHGKDTRQDNTWIPPWSWHLTLPESMEAPRYFCIPSLDSIPRTNPRKTTPTLPFSPYLSLTLHIPMHITILLIPASAIGSTSPSSSPPKPISLTIVTISDFIILNLTLTLSFLQRAIYSEAPAQYELAGFIAAGFEEASSYTNLQAINLAE